VLIVSDKYGCSKLKDQVEKIMISSELTHENVSGLFVISDRHNANKLKQVCCEYIRQHYSQVKKTSQYREIQSEVENILKSTEENISTQSNNHRK
jgi:altronate dehydratase